MQDRAGLETLLRTLWCEALSVSEVSDDDHFLDLGGNSITAMEIAAQLEEELHHHVAVDVLMAAGSFRSAVDAIEASGHAQDS
jgi:acyl carrier protein